jgi:hypothetical protein
MLPWPETPLQTPGLIFRESPDIQRRAVHFVDKQFFESVNLRMFLSRTGIVAQGF